MEEKRKTKQKLTYQVKEAYYQVWLAEKLVLTAKASYENLGLHVTEVEKLFKVGTVSKFEVLRAQVQHEGLKPQIITTENLLAMAKLNLVTLIGYDKEAQFTVYYDPNALDEKYNIPLADLINSAYQKRSEIRQLKLGMEMSKIQTALNVSDKKPKASLNLNYEGAGTNLNPDDWGKSWNLVLGIQGDFFNAVTKPNIEAAKRQEELLQIQESGLKDQIHLEVQQVLQSIKEALQNIKAHQANIELSKESLRMTQARFDAGMATTMDIMDAQLALDEAQNGYYKGINSYLTALANMDFVTGKDF
jgi:outer membrane protein TolC